MALMLLYGAETHRRRVDHLTGSEGADLLYQTGYDEGLEGQPEALPVGEQRAATGGEPSVCARPSQALILRLVASSVTGNPPRLNCLSSRRSASANYAAKAGAQA